MSNTTRTNQNPESLPFLSSQERLNAYQLIIDGCSHIWSKNKLQQEKAQAALDALIPLTKNDPYFLAHLASYAAKKSKSKDLQVFLAYAATLSSADGMPFSQGSEYKKPNLRYVGAAALQNLDPKLVDRIVDIANRKYSVTGLLNSATHFPNTLRTAVKKYVQYREAHPEYITGIKRAGLGNVLKNLYRKMRLHPNDETAKILRWEQRDHKIDFGERPYTFENKTDLQIAETIRSEKIPYLGVLAELSRVKKKVSPVIAVAMLEQATGNQAVIMQSTFEDAGILNDPEVMKLYEEKIKTAKTALDRAETLSKDASTAMKQALSSARAENRQAQTAGIGKIYLMLDFSGSMNSVQRYASERGAILAECVNDPANNFKWGAFGSRGEELPLPDKFVKDAFAAILFARQGMGSTNCFALYSNARDFGADVDVYVSDQENTDGDLTAKIRRYHTTNPDVKKPKACVVIHFTGSWSRSHDIKDAYEANGIPVVEMKPDSLTESALVVDAVKTALLGPVAVIDDIMAEPLLDLPKWYYTL